MIFDPFARNLSRERIPDIVRNLLIQSRNGAFRRLDHRESDFWFSIERLDGSDSTAVLALRIPRRDWSVTIVQELQSTFESHGFEWVDEKDNPSLLGKVIIPVQDIWAKSSGAKGGYAARLLMDTVGLPVDARFNMEVGGQHVYRRHEDQ